jgi:4-hydroxy-3-polyprenylbenzoate decarboxylase
MTENELTNDVEMFIKAVPRSWKEILEKYHGQPYPLSSAETG